MQFVCHDYSIRISKKDKYLAIADFAGQHSGRPGWSFASNHVANVAPLGLLMHDRAVFDGIDKAMDKALMVIELPLHNRSYVWALNCRPLELSRCIEGCRAILIDAGQLARQAGVIYTKDIADKLSQVRERSQPRVAKENAVIPIRHTTK